MTKSSWLGLLVALFLPLGSYWLVKLLGQNAVQMPPRYFVDSVITKKVDGKTLTDTVFHTLPDFSFTNQLQQPVSLQTVAGKILVVNTFFTRCPNICPALTRNIRTLQTSFENPKRKKFGDTSIVYFLSISVDPERDSVEALKNWANRFFVNSDSWSLVTGSKQIIYPFLLNELKLSTKDGGAVDSNFIHTEKLVLIDRDRIIRGYYNGLDSTDLRRLAEDIGKLFLEKDKSKPSIFREYIPIVPILVMIPGLVWVFLFFLNKNRRKERH